MRSLYILFLVGAVLVAGTTDVRALPDDLLILTQAEQGGQRPQPQKRAAGGTSDQKFLQNPMVQQMLRDPDLQRQLTEDPRFESLMQDPQMQRLVQSPQFQRQMQQNQQLRQMYELQKRPLPGVGGDDDD